MPFDNLLVLQKLKGNILQQLLDLAASKGGWPLAGITMQIKDKKSNKCNWSEESRWITSKIYILVNSDF